MKRAELLALIALIGLLLIAGLLLFAAGFYGGVAHWAGFMLASGQALLAGFVFWGLRLARQQADLNDLGTPAPAQSAGNAFRMSVTDETAAPIINNPTEIRTLDTGLQRVLTALSGIAFLALGATTIYLIAQVFKDAEANPGEPFPITRHPLDELGLLIALVSAAGYLVLWGITRPRRNDFQYTEAVNSHFTLGALGMIAVGAAGILAWMKVGRAQEFAAGLVAALMILQGLELLINALRSYSSIEEFDQEPVDLQALPLVPMLGSVWLASLRQLFAQSLGLAGESERGVIGRMMPRAILASIILAIILSCFRVVPMGEVAVLERLGHALKDKDGNVLIHKPGLHFTAPWPIDEFVNIPQDRMNFLFVGAELEAPKEFKGLDFTFWTYRHSKEEAEEESEFVTGDPDSPQMLETFVGIWWRVRDPMRFYSSLSHSEFYEQDGGKTKVLPIYEAIIQEAAKAAVTHTYARSTLDDIMTVRRGDVERRCQAFLQKHLDELGENGSGIEIVTLTIKDVHPPYGEGEVPDPREQDKVRRGPAHAYENVVNKRQLKEQLINDARARAIREIALAYGEAVRATNEAVAYRTSRIAEAEGQAARLRSMVADWDKLPPSERQFLTELARRNYIYDQTREPLPNVQKILLGPGVTPPDIYQTNGDKINPVRPPSP